MRFRLSSLFMLIMGVALSTIAYPWNAVGHRLIAQIAYDQLSPSTIRYFNRYNRAMSPVHPANNWLNAAVWLDAVRHQNVITYNDMHYVDLFFTEDNTPLPRAPETNAITAVQQALEVLQQPHASAYQKGIAFRILLHVVGDIHQPMHATSRVSQRFPDGDRGGNLVELRKNSIAKNLHAYWDNGGGYLKCTPSKSPKHRRKRRKHALESARESTSFHKTYPAKPKQQCNIKAMARHLEHMYPCQEFDITVQPVKWADESHQLGVYAYEHLFFDQPDIGYQTHTIQTTQLRIAQAGCRLAGLLNSVHMK